MSTTLKRWSNRNSTVDPRRARLPGPDLSNSASIYLFAIVQLQASQHDVYFVMKTDK